MQSIDVVDGEVILHHSDDGDEEFSILPQALAAMLQ